MIYNVPLVQQAFCTYDFQKLPDAVPMTENIKPESNVQPQQTMLKVMKPHSAASNQDSKSDNKPHGNRSLKDVGEDRPLNNNITVTDAITFEHTYDTLPEMKLESACHESHTTLTKGKHEATLKSPKKVKPDDHGSHIPGKTEAKSQLMHKSKSVKTTAKGSTDVAKNCTDLPKKSVVTSSDSEEEETKKLDSGDITHDLKSSSERLERSDAPNKPKSQNHGNLSKPNDDKLGTPV